MFVREGECYSHKRFADETSSENVSDGSASAKSDKKKTKSDKKAKSDKKKAKSDKKKAKSREMKAIVEVTPEKDRKSKPKKDKDRKKRAKDPTDCTSIDRDVKRSKKRQKLVQ